IDGHWWKVTPKWVWGIFLALVAAVVGLTIGCTHLYNENDKLRQEEWMYRKTRTYFNTEELQKELMNMECDFYRGTWQEQDSIKDNIRWREKHFGIDKTFLHFYPTEE
ncbi:MAG: hypothetical protein NC453_18790, partial [Muribaculum sp.]|nr:hypothetical protein [Muribaculum sp.]